MQVLGLLNIPSEVLCMTEVSGPMISEKAAKVKAR